MGLTIGIAGCENSRTNAETTELTVAAAASLTDVMEEIAVLYNNSNPNVDLKFTFGGSGALMTQIEEGAPVDVFISAAQKQMDTLEEKGMIKDDTRVDLLSNQVVLITSKSTQKEIESFEDIATDKVEKIALGDPSSVPVGQYSQEIFDKLGIVDEADKKAVYAADVRQVLSWVVSGEVDCGIVYRTDAITSGLVTIVTQAPYGSHNPVIYPAALVDGTNNTDAGEKFIEFLFTDQAKSIFEKYGFNLV